MLMSRIITIVLTLYLLIPLMSWSQDTTASGKRFTFTPKESKYILKRLYYADSCDKIVTYYQKELLHSNVIINDLQRTAGEYELMIMNQNTLLENKNKELEIQKKRMLKFKIGVIGAAVAGFFIGRL